jgi:pimeloyl-ACP methyl ester carboxylesterase
MSSLSWISADDGARLAVRVRGEGQDALLVPGWLSSGAAWEGVARTLALFGLRAIALDPRGTGGSDRRPPGGDDDRLARDLAVAADALGVRDAVLVAHGPACVAGRALARRRPDLVAAALWVAPVPVEGLGFGSGLAAVLRTAVLGADHLAPLLELLAGAPLPTAVRAAAIRDALAVEPWTALDGIDTMRAGGEAAPRALRSVSLRGARDPLPSGGEGAVPIAGLGHLLSWQAPEALASMAAGLARGVGARAARRRRRPGRPARALACPRARAHSS